MGNNFISMSFKNKLNGDLAVMKLYATGDMLIAVNDKYTNLEGLNWNVASIVKEFPDLAGQAPGIIRKEGLIRFKKHVQELLSWEAKKNSIVKSLEPFGYGLLFWTTVEGRVVRK